MSVVRMARFEVEPADVGKLMEARTALLDALRQRCTGLTGARLGRVDERTWVDLWLWESRDDLDRALAAGQTISEAPTVFALTQNLTTEDLDVVDES
jgi:hypothetical protein